MGRRVAAAELMSLASPGETGLGRPHPASPDAAIDRIERDLAIVASGRPRRRAAPPRRRRLRGRLDRDREGGPGADASPPSTASSTSAATRPPSASSPPAAAARRRPRSRTLAALPLPPPAGARLPPRALGGARARLPARRPELRLALPRRRPAALRLAPRRRPPARRRDAAARRSRSSSGRSWTRRREQLVPEGAILNEALLAPAKGSIRSAFSELLRREAEADDGFVPAQFEQRFEGVEVPLGDGRTISFAGSIDRVDLASGDAKRVRVVDYKTGKLPWKKDEQFRGGRELQLAIYNRAADQALRGRLGERGDLLLRDPERGATSRRPAPRRRRWTRPSSASCGPSTTTARAGVFAPVADTCDFCDFQAVCGGGARGARRAEEGRPPPRRLPEAAGDPVTPRPPPRRPVRPRPRDDRLRHDLPPRGGRRHGQDDRPREAHPRAPAGGPGADRPHRGDHLHRQGGGGAEGPPARRHREGARVGERRGERAPLPTAAATSSGRPSPRSTPSPRASCASGPSRPASTPASRSRPRSPPTAPSTTPGTPGSRSGWRRATPSSSGR